MARIAEWRLAPNDPKRPFRWLIQMGFRWERPTGEQFLKIGGPVLAVSVLSIASQFWWLLTVVPVIVAVVGIRSTAEPTEHASIPTLVGDDGPFPVGIRIMHRGCLVGEDTGWIDFCEGWLIYQGRRTELSITPRDLYAREATQVPFELTLRDGTIITIRLVTSMSETVLPARQHDFQRLLQEANRWMAETPRKGESVLPPRTVHPASYMSRGQHYFFLGVAAMVVAGVLSLPFNSFPTQLFALLTAGPLFLVAAINWMRIPSAHRQLVQATTESPYSPMPAEPLRP